MMTLSVLEIHSRDVQTIGDAVQQQIQRAPEFFAHMPVLLSLHEHDIDLSALTEVLAAADLVAVGVLDADAETAEAAQAAGLGLLSSPTARGSHNGAKGSAAVHAQPPNSGGNGSSSAQDSQNDEMARSTPTRLVTQPVRSGQQIYARGGDLVVMASVSEGAEVLADGHIHIYGALRGRALAGASGDTRGRIFCRRFEPDLIAIAGCYKVADTIDEGLRGACVQVCLQDDSLVIDLQE